ncbi:double-strand break repair helicase AddA [Sulfitobacter sp. SK011]|uniref:double-strand break repair helicase AddA n=1 Tax=Sulfitobacter sp. SK011 TaxID=1389004 RepID=UPI000E0A3450|nr:double-strand break repair helicase AddA [Sulfitobacter sp. SK011]AXI40608.1 double-strand break repair helicase AddA [Sulfitobacter sp. SK011]
MTARFDDATRAQIDAARPDASTWLTANAGSGKTRVLTDRVARLLLDKVEPQQILCLTYTKAAASEMQNRLFKRLGEWAMLDDEALRISLADLGITDILAPDRLRDARTLFARAIETPGGLKIQTIHSFCASLLRRFPLEAGVNPQFSEIEDRAADLLRAEIVDSMAEGSQSQLIADVARHYIGEDFSKLTRSIVTQRDAFLQPLTVPDTLALFDQPPDLTWEKIEAAVFDGNEQDLITQMIPHLLAKGGNDLRAGETLGAVSKFDMSALPTLEKVFLTGSGANAPFTAKIGSFPTKPTQGVIAYLMADLDALMQRVEDAREARLALLAAEKSAVLHRFAHAFLIHYEAQKQLRGWLDFDDLILKTRALLTDKAVAAWVLYRIDGGIDHILVDEAQDTSPRQWDVVEKLTDEFYRGAGAREDVQRTLFVVGDKKQSIYSFQGADPREFDRKSAIFERTITDAGQMFQHRSLDYSFRSSSAILRMVDTALDSRVQPGFDKETLHKPFKSDLPGRVDLWPLVERSATDDDHVWTDPVDRRSAQHHTVILAEQIAAKIKELTIGEHFIPDDRQANGALYKRRIQPGDFLILVQRRSPLFSEIIRACKAADLPIAGADRLKVGAELAVKDLAALLSFLTTPDDDLALATALKSPLFGWGEQSLFDLTHRRTEERVWQSLRKRVEEFPETIAVLRDLRAQVDFLRPYDLIERILTRHDGRAKLLARLGPEAEDGINAMLTQALAYERNNVPSLTEFLEWMQTDDLEIKRQIDASSNQIRVMTVHGAKGLEAPIVILPDTGRRDITIKDEIIKMEGVPVWKVSIDEMPSAMRHSVEGMKSSQFEERLRLLYVAMTRAEKWLIVAAAGDLSKDSNSWYQITQAAMSHVNGVPVGTEGAVRFEEGDWDGLPVGGTPQSTADQPVLEPVFLQPAPMIVEMPKTLSPSELGGAKALPGEDGADQETAKSYGSLVHLLLEHAHDPIGHGGAGVDPGVLANAQREASAVLKAPNLSHIFGSDTLAEVAVTGTIGTLRVHGTIDRLLVSENTILAVDFKTNRVVPQSPEACPEGLLRQMGAYAHVLAQIYPKHEIRTAILWTTCQELMVLPHNIVTSALERSPYLDDAGVGS